EGLGARESARQENVAARVHSDASGNVSSPRDPTSRIDLDRSEAETRHDGVSASVDGEPRYGVGAAQALAAKNRPVFVEYGQVRLLRPFGDEAAIVEIDHVRKDPGDVNVGSSRRRDELPERLRPFQGSGLIQLDRSSGGAGREGVALSIDRNTH